MRFRRLERCPWTDTPRKRAALRRRQRLEREALPLFAGLIAEEQPSEDDEMQRRAIAAARWEQERRDQHAADWRRARRRLNVLGCNMRAMALAYWNAHRWLPGSPEYLADLVTSIQREKLLPDDTSVFRFQRQA